ncbi:3',5'-cyclic-AMP phosphodiesterase [Pseudomonas sp. RIT-PI-S]|uniref:3',5'-cyclic-AMP phosphodiesterase n=1 Tax=Pseudomonas sp. RIT-PI-S TaxID=3035295 RepID=UPI0021DA4840|nr:3',5'-cyclic-AMP phosphodiesterase [Pseudomonas sp. RIT-PI-S]
MPNRHSTRESSVLLLQLTDSHLFAEADGTLLGMNTADSLRQVVERVMAEQPTVDLMIATGDLSQDGTLASYERFREMTACIDAPHHWMAGNHDEAAVMAEHYGGSELMRQVVDIGNWRITMLDSSVSGSVPGWLAEDQLQTLEASLQGAPDRHHLVCLHHHPVSIDCKWMEPIGLRNAEAFLAVIDRYPQVRAVLWGHIHQQLERERNGVRLLASPSTCVQFKPLSEDFSLDRIAPGYRWLRLNPNGQLDTGISRVPGFEFAAEFGGSGY